MVMVEPTSGTYDDFAPASDGPRATQAALIEMLKRTLAYSIDELEYLAAIERALKEIQRLTASVQSIAEALKLVSS
jgi:hypothetical protein